MFRSIVVVAFLGLAGCSPPHGLPFPQPQPQPQPQTAPPRFETLDDTSFAMNSATELTITRTAQPNEATPVEADVQVLIMTADSQVIVAERQTIAVGSTSTATIRFTAPRTPTVEIVVNWGAAVGATQLRGFVAEVLDPTNDTIIEFVDRMDQCQTIQRAVDHTFCEQNNQVFVYGPTGTFEQMIEGREVRAVGSEVWISQVVGLSHWTDTPSGLRYDATAPLWLGAPYGETTPGRALRGTDRGIAIVTWDGTTLSHTLLEGFPPLGVPQAMIEQGSDLVIHRLFNSSCRFDRGCTSRTCDPLVTCDLGASIGSDTRQVWFLGFDANGQSIAIYRTKTQFAITRQFQIPQAAGLTFIAREEELAIHRASLSMSDFVLLPTADETGGWLQLWRHRGVPVALSADWLIARMDAKTLKFHNAR